jgi:hypothetical protein
MKTTNQNEAPANVRPSSVSNISKTVQADFVRHCTNRRLSTETVLTALETGVAPPSCALLHRAFNEERTVDIVLSAVSFLARLHSLP